jgi:regulator of sirC expression with transglutaminase-like and TPR domain
MAGGPHARFAELVSRPDEQIDLAEASLLIACGEYPDLDVATYLRRLDGMGAAVAERLEGRSAWAILAALNRYLFEELGFAGNSEDYYNPRNSFLNDVLDSRRGIPITLSTVYLEVAARAGLSVQGVGLPGHFILKARVDGAELLIDPFHGGTLLSHADCQERLERVFGGRVRIEPGMLASCSRREILSRMLRNLKTIYLKAGDQARALRSLELLLALRPDDTQELRDRGLAHAALDCYLLAARDLEAYLARVPRAPEADELRRTIEEMRFRASRLN